MSRLVQYSPLDVLLDRPRAKDFPQHACKFLIQGDSWFSFGSVNPMATGSVFEDMFFGADCGAVNCAHPGDVLNHMIDLHQAPLFNNLLCGNQAWAWDALILSPGGNDLIDFIRTPSVAKGKPVPQNLRALLLPGERNSSSAEACLSEAGWQTFIAYLVPQIEAFIALRDGPGSKSVGVPIFVHTYDFLTPRNAGAGLGVGPWLYPALRDYQVPEAQWEVLSKLFLQRFAQLLQSLQLPNFHVIDTQGLLTPAVPQSEGPSNDWENEIHPNPAGYEKMARVFAAGIEQGLSV